MAVNEVSNSQTNDRSEAMADNETDRLLNEIGQLLAEDREYPLDGTLLYAELDRNVVSPSIFKELGNEILYRHPDLDRLGDALLDLWEAQSAEDRWVEIECLVRDGTFDVTYVYPDEIDPEEDFTERRDRVVRRHFGDKRIVYPPWSPEDDAPDYDL
jgi:hypothetical protein